MRALSQLGVKCPEQVSVVGFDNFDWTEMFTPKLTTVVQSSYEIGKRAVEMLLRRIGPEGGRLEAGEETRVVLKAHLCVRESTAPPST